MSSSSSINRSSSRAMDEASGIVRRIVNIPRTLMNSFSRSMGIIGNTRRNNNPNPPQIFPPQAHQLQPPIAPIIHEEWAFLASFEDHFGTVHPFFYACRFAEALRVAREEHKPLFVYLHAPEHPFTRSFCRETLCCEVVVEFLDVNFVCWGGIVNSGEGLEMCRLLNPQSFPFCAVVAPSSADNMAVLQQIEGPVSPAELVEILQRTMEEQGLAFGITRPPNHQQENRRRADDRQLREEQDAAYLAALRIDKEKDRLKNLPSEQRVRKLDESSAKLNSGKVKENLTRKQNPKVKEASNSRETQPENIANTGNPAQVTQILLRFPNGERREKSFLCTDKVQSIYRYVDSLGLPEVGNYKLISNFPRKVYGVDQMGMTLKDAGLHPRASLFLEIM